MCISWADISITKARPTKLRRNLLEQSLDSVVIIRTKNHPDGWLFENRKGGVWHSPMLAHSDDSTLLALRIGLQDVLAVTLMELVKVLEFGGLEWQVVGGECDSSTHDH